eukprot:355486-Chlamydomonas_euryale.AAC.3
MASHLASSPAARSSEPSREWIAAMRASSRVRAAAASGAAAALAMAGSRARTRPGSFSPVPGLELASSGGVPAVDRSVTKSVEAGGPEEGGAAMRVARRTAVRGCAVAAKGDRSTGRSVGRSVACAR